MFTDTLRKLNEVLDEVQQYFECEGGYCIPDNYTSFYWTAYHDDKYVSFGNEIPDCEDDFDFGDEVYGSAIFRKDDYTMVVLSREDGLHPVIFDNAKEIIYD
jgi:hypothetical protein